jgi:uncharacterized protein
MTKARLPAKSAAARLLHRPDPTFLADAMLGSVARKLRIFGFDTAYVAHTAADDEVLKLGVEQGRIILTADKEFFKRIVSRRDAKGVLVKGSSDFDDLLHIFGKLGIRSASVVIGSRCAACNGLLAGKKPSEVSGMVPEAVLARHGSFYQCTGCGRVYWDGSHLHRLRALAEKLEKNLANNPAPTKG